MPLASSRSASEKRAAVAKAERERNERLERISLPRTINSSTRVTRESAKRRRNSRAQSEERMKKQVKAPAKEAEELDMKVDNETASTKENLPTIDAAAKVKPKSPPPKAKANAKCESSPPQKRDLQQQEKEEDPGPLLQSPTPYWKVAQDRRKSKKFSPPITRSSKKKKPRRDSVENNGGAITLTFSPPDQEENARREKEEHEKQRRIREQTISEARQSGRYLEFSPNSFSCRNMNWNSVDATTKRKDCDGGDNDDYQKEVNPDNKKDDEDDNGVEEPSFTSEQSRGSPGTGRNSEGSNISDFSSSAQQQSDLEIKNDLKSIKQTLEMVVNDRRNSDVGFVQVKQNMLALAEEQAKTKMLETQLSDVRRQLEKEKKDYQEEQRRLEVELQASQKESSENVESLEKQVAELEKEKTFLLNQITVLEEDLKAAKAMLSTNAADAKAIEDLMAQIDALKEKDKECDQLQETLKNMKDTRSNHEFELEQTAKELQSYKTKFEDSNTQLQTALTKIKDLETEKQERETSMNDLMERIRTLREEKDVTSGELGRMKEELDKLQACKNNQDKQISDLREALEKAQKKHKVTRESFTKEKESVEASLSTLKSALEASAQSLRAAEDKGAAKALEAREKEDRILELERQLLEMNAKYGAAVERLSTSDEREEELHRKLGASDRIRCELHNKVMQLAGNIRVFVRVRPSISGEEEKLDAMLAEKTKGRRNQNKPPVTIESPFSFPDELDARDSSGSSEDLTKRLLSIKEPPKDRGGLSDRRQEHTYAFDNIFGPNSGQEEVWEAVEPLVQSSIDGYRTCIFAYGQTGSGKTFTMLGEPENEGIIARSVKKMFVAKQEIEEFSRGTAKVEISVELLEIYNEQVRDLLASKNDQVGKEVTLKIRANEVVGNKHLSADSVEKVMGVLAVAQTRRCVKATQSNEESSRSHMVFTMHFKVTKKNGVQSEGRLNICDLAGSERIGKSGANHLPHGELMKETKYINSSLSVLSNVIEKLQSGSSSIPYRESKLTFLLQNSLGGNSKTLAIVCCNPHPAHYSESHCSIKFAEKLNKVELKGNGRFKC